MSQAVILAAGQGQRLGGLAPKALAWLGQETLLGRQLRLLQARGVAPITVVGGFQCEQLRAALPEGVRLVENADYRRGSVVSWRAAPLEPGQPVLLSHGDLAYDEALLDLALAGGTLGDPHYRVRTGDEVLIWSVDGRAGGLGRGAPVEPYDRFGEFVGLSGLDASFAEAFQQYCLSRPADQDYEVPILSDFTQANPLPVRYLEPGQFWMNVNYPEDLEEARQRFA